MAALEFSRTISYSDHIIKRESFSLSQLKKIERGTMLDEITRSGIEVKV